MIATLTKKFPKLTIDFKVIPKGDEVIVFMMPSYEGDNKLDAMKFVGPPEEIESNIVSALNEMSTNDTNSVNDLNKFLKSVEKAKADKVTKKKSEPAEKKKEESKPSLF